jgi:iron complex transport system ATP-binding protein
MNAAVHWQRVTIERGGAVVVRDVELAVPVGAWLSVLGPNGAGKTSLIRSLVDLRPASGRVLVDGVPLDRASPRSRARRIAVVPQHPVIPPGIPVFDYVLLGRTPHQGLAYGASRDDRRKTHAVMQRLDLDQFGHRALDSLSGGERQRAVLARALAQETSILVLDEPTTFLDLGHQYDVLEIVAELRVEHGVTVITTMHDLTIAGQFADHVAVLHHGSLLALGTPVEVLTPAVIADVWGVDAAVSRDARGGVDINVRRRREPIVDPASSEPGSVRPTPVLQERP